MDIVLFLIFFFTNIFVVAICQYAYGKRDRYEGGMLMGVHIPPWALEDEEVKRLSEKSQRQWKLFNRVNLAVSLLICLLCFWNDMVFVIIYILWLVEYMCLLWFLVMLPHRKLYEIKIKNQWISEVSRRVVQMDTEVSALKKEKPWSLKWHIPLLAILALSGILWQDLWTGGEELLGERILFFTSLGISFVFFLFHLGILRRKEEIYGGNADVNAAANNIVKKMWSVGLVLSSWINGAAWIFLAAKGWRGQWVGTSAYIVYFLMIFLEASSLIAPIMWGLKKKRHILGAVTEAYSIDDDEYWKNGWYNNPNDPHILVQDRMNSMNMSFNYGRPAARVITGAAIVLLAAVLLWTITIIMRFVDVTIVFADEGDCFRFEAAGYHCEFTQEDILDVKLLDDMPDDDFVRTNGGSTDDYDIGHFKGKETGKCMMFVDKGAEQILQITLDDQTVFAAGDSGEDTANWYRMLSL